MNKKHILKFLFLALPTMGLFAQNHFTIENSWKYAFENNVNIKKAKIDRHISDSKVKESVGVGLPQVDAHGGYNYFLNIPVQLIPAKMIDPKAPCDAFIPLKMGQKQNMTGGITLKQLIFNASYLVGLKSSKAYRESTFLMEEKTEITVKEAVLLSYVAVLITQENIQTLEENVNVAKKILDHTREVYKKGLTEEQKVQQLEYSFKNLSTNLENLRRTKEKLLMALKYVMGYPLEGEIILDSDIDEILKDNELLLADQENSDLSGHIDLRLRDNALKLSRLQLQFQKSKSLPYLSAGVSSTYNAYGSDFSFFESKQDWFNTSVVALQLEIPIFSGLQRHWQIQEAKLNVMKAELDKEDTKNNLKNVLYSAKTDYKNAYDSYKTAEELLQLTKDIHRKEQIKFEKGLGSSFDLQNSETQLYNSQSNYYKSTMELIQNKIKLNEAMGRL